ncbi:MAG: NADAR family protein [Lachnospiraceae bacterium]|nr:NADAR family protein [Lachnospiraceae bacterium]
MGNSIICFYHEYEEYGCFSNWYKAYFEYVGRRFSSVEQYMMYHKALMFREYELSEQIANTDNPALIKKLGRSYMKSFNSDLWDKTSKQIVKRAIRAKFEQNPELLDVLLGTEELVLTECSKNDKKWGNGVAIDDEDRFCTSKWTGKNLLGRILMEVRDELRRAKAKGTLGYVDAHDLEFPHWNMMPGDLKCVPKFYDVIHAYSDTLLGDYERKCFYECPFSGWDLAMRVNMGGGLPAIGFYEMKQDIYDTIRFS